MVSQAAHEPLAAQLFRFLRSRAMEGMGLTAIARASGYSDRQFRRLIVDAFGVSPVEVVQNERLLFAKRLLHDTHLPLAAVALAAGFKSIRRFNACFLQRQRLTPGQIRRRSVHVNRRENPNESLKLFLAYRPPFAWPELLRSLRNRVTPGVDAVTTDGRYLRTCRLENFTGWLVVHDIPHKAHLEVSLSPSLAPVMASISSRLRNLFDLDANPVTVAVALKHDPMLAPLIQRFPGLRIPGTFDVFEGAVRAVIGLRATAAAAGAVAGRLAQQCSAVISTPFSELNWLGMTPESLGRVAIEDLGRLGMNRRRAETLGHLSAFAKKGGLEFPPVARFEQVHSQLLTVPGIGSGIAYEVAQRTFRYPDVFPAGDADLQRAVGGHRRLSAREVEQRSQAWRPWRAYAAALLWESLNENHLITL